MEEAKARAREALNNLYANYIDAKEAGDTNLASVYDVQIDGGIEVYEKAFGENVYRRTDGTLVYEEG